MKKHTLFITWLLLLIAGNATADEPIEVLMNNEHQEITVGDTPIMLYDDGGKDGEITSEYNGLITFVPADATKRIQVDFQKVALANGSIYYQYIAVYNGHSQDPSQLLKTLRHGETCIHSRRRVDNYLPRHQRHEANRRWYRSPDYPVHATAHGPGPCGGQPPHPRPRMC